MTKARRGIHEQATSAYPPDSGFIETISDSLRRRLRGREPTFPVRTATAIRSSADEVAISKFPGNSTLRFDALAQFRQSLLIGVKSMLQRVAERY